MIDARVCFMGFRVLAKRFLLKIHDVPAFRRERWNAARMSNGGSGQGLTLAMDMKELKSLSQVGRDFASKLSKTSVPFEVFDMGGNPAAPKIGDEELFAMSPFLHENISNRRVMIFASGEIEKDCRNYNILTPFWEFESGKAELEPRLFDGVSHVVAFSRFLERYFKEIVPADVGVSHVRYPLSDGWRVAEDRDSVRDRYGMGPDDFVVFFHFDFRSGYDRKNPEGAIHAFLEAFGDDPRAKMVVKAGGGDWDLRNGMKFSAFIRKLGIGNRLIVVDRFLRHQEILDLIASSDVYLSLHRGEGLGIGMLEAMAVKTPVIATGYGGNVDFTTPETAYMVGYRMVKPNTTYQLYRYVKEWPEPDIHEAAAHLRKIRSSPDEARVKAEAALAFVKDYFSAPNFERDVRARLAATEAPCR